MHWQGDIHIDRVVPKPDDVLRALGVPHDREPNERTRDAVTAGLEELRAVAAPSGVFTSISSDDFLCLYAGEGNNATPSPLPLIVHRATELVLFAVTVGAPISARITALFESGDYALGGILDAAASEATELTAERI
ncbi:hypothetical protein K8S17_04415, partial [bacterium]|nr:hypothetical protein [bacterium]